MITSAMTRTPTTEAMLVTCGGWRRPSTSCSPSSTARSSDGGCDGNPATLPKLTPIQALLMCAAARCVDRRVIPPDNVRGGARCKPQTLQTSDCTVTMTKRRARATRMRVAAADAAVADHGGGSAGLRAAARAEPNLAAEQRGAGVLGLAGSAVRADGPPNGVRHRAGDRS